MITVLNNNQDILPLKIKLPGGFHPDATIATTTSLFTSFASLEKTMLEKDEYDDRPIGILSNIHNQYVPIKYLYHSVMETT